MIKMQPNEFRHTQPNGNDAHTQDKNPHGNGYGDNNNNGNKAANGLETIGASKLEFPTFQTNTSYVRRKPNEEDEQFFKLAKEAIVHTANVTSSSDRPQIVDPTLNDLFMRLQYVSSPHGNPIKNGQNIRVNDSGQLMIHEFYENFPNLNNNIFQQDTKPNGLIGENPLKHLDSSSSSIQSLQNQINDNSLPTSSNEELEERKYECPKCLMNFKRSSDLKRHEKQHLEIPPNICEFCGKGFARKDALKRHVGTATCKRNAEKKLYIENLEFLNR